MPMPQAELTAAVTGVVSCLVRVAPLCLKFSAAWERPGPGALCVRSRAVLVTSRRIAAAVTRRGRGQLPVDDHDDRRSAALKLT